jgi:hypothetical protein
LPVPLPGSSVTLFQPRKPSALPKVEVVQVFVSLLFVRDRQDRRARILNRRPYGTAAVLLVDFPGAEGLG